MILYVVEHRDDGGEGGCGRKCVQRTTLYVGSVPQFTRHIALFEFWPIVTQQSSTNTFTRRTILARFGRRRFVSLACFDQIAL